MKQKLLHRALVYAIALASLTLSCSKTNLRSAAEEFPAAAYSTTTLTNSYFGSYVQMGNGRARSYIVIKHDGKPVEIGVELSADAMQGLPTDPNNHSGSAFNLPFHQKAKGVTAIDHLVINWNVHGHEPPGLFDLPHFDFHFYTISQQQRMAATNMNDMEMLPAEADWPTGYLPVPGGVPQMGKHWLSSEFVPPFSSTFVWGSYRGVFTFMEPMITLQQFQPGVNFAANFPMPGNIVPRQKFYPSTYNYYSKSGKYYVSLTNFSWY